MSRRAAAARADSNALFKMRELLLAYLFGQLDPDQREQVERALEDEPQLREELRQLRMCLGQDSLPTEEVVEPPPGLVERTCSRIVSCARPSSDLGGSDGPRAAAEWETPAPSESAGPCTWDSGAQRSCSRGDLAVALGLSMAAAMLLFPALYDSQILARQTACQDNLRQLYFGISTFASANGGLIPHVPAEGRESFAGIFAILLGEREFIDRRELPQLLRCPGTADSNDTEEDTLLLQFWIPTREQLLTAPDELVAALQRQVGGNYAYRLGYLDQLGRYRPWRLDHSSRSALLADAPSLHLESFRSTNHGGRGQNVLFADGHVGFICDCAELSCGDELFKNAAGYRAAGMDSIDIVLAPSDGGPALKLLRAIFEWGDTPR